MVACKHRPCVLCLDNIDVLARRRGATSSSTGVEERALSQMLNEMDGIQGSDGVFVLACANCPLSGLDAAVLRPGRLELVLELPLPSEVAKIVRHAPSHSLLR